MPNRVGCSSYNSFVFSEAGRVFSRSHDRMSFPWPTSAKGGGFRPLLTQNPGVPNHDFCTASVTT
jgi:hypothetical protein